MRNMYPCDYGGDCDLILPTYAAYRAHVHELHWEQYHLLRDGDVYLMLRGDDGFFRCGPKECSFARKDPDLVRMHTIRCALFANALERGRLPYAVVEGLFEKTGTLIQPCSRTRSEAAYARHRRDADARNTEGAVSATALSRPVRSEPTCREATNRSNSEDDDYDNRPTGDSGSLQVDEFEDEASRDPGTRQRPSPPVSINYSRARVVSGPSSSSGLPAFYAPSVPAPRPTRAPLAASSRAAPSTASPAPLSRPLPPSAVLVIGLSPTTTVREIRLFFSSFGRIDDFSLKLDPARGESLGVCWIRFAEPEPGEVDLPLRAHEVAAMVVREANGDQVGSRPGLVERIVVEYDEDGTRAQAATSAILAHDRYCQAPSLAPPLSSSTYDSSVSPWPHHDVDSLSGAGYSQANSFAPPRLPGRPSDAPMASPLSPLESTAYGNARHGDVSPCLASLSESSPRDEAYPRSARSIVTRSAQPLSFETAGPATSLRPTGSHKRARKDPADEAGARGAPRQRTSWLGWVVGSLPVLG